MRLPHRWKIFGPGLLIPVFFLSVCPVSGQIYWQDATVAACGGAFGSRSGYNNAISNQAGLGWVKHPSVTIQHTRPFILTDLGISSLSAQLPAGNGAFGGSLTCLGIKGLYQTSGWISYGMKLHPEITAGAGINFRIFSIPDHLIYHPGISCALGIQARITDQFIAGGHVMYPIGWSAYVTNRQNPSMILTAGCSYTFFNTATYHGDLHLVSNNHLQVSHGIELAIRERARISLGMHNHPYAASFGIGLATPEWNIQVTVEYLLDTGSLHSSSLTYVW